MTLAASSSSSSSLSAPTISLKFSDHIRGRVSAPVTIVQYSDFECSFCQLSYPIVQQVARKYRTKVSWVFRQFPLDQHPHARSAAEASECAASLGGNIAFWGLADALMEKRVFTDNDYLPIAKRLGIDSTKFTQCIDRGTFTKKVADMKTGGLNAGVDGTPTFFIVSRTGRYEEKMSGAQSIDAFEAVIDRMLQEVATGNPGGFKQ